jgi:hypothetical protein
MMNAADLDGGVGAEVVVAVGDIFLILKTETRRRTGFYKINRAKGRARLSSPRPVLRFPLPPISFLPFLRKPIYLLGVKKAYLLNDL